MCPTQRRVVVVLRPVARFSREVVLVCGLDPGQAWAGSVAGAPATAGEALAMVMAGLGWLADADLASVPASVQADCLRGLERAQSVFTAARAAVLGVFEAGGGFEVDGSRSARTWLMWQTQVTSVAAT